MARELFYEGSRKYPESPQDHGILEQHEENQTEEQKQVEIFIDALSWLKLHPYSCNLEEYPPYIRELISIDVFLFPETPELSKAKKSIPHKKALILSEEMIDALIGHEKILNHHGYLSEAVTIAKQIRGDESNRRLVEKIITVKDGPLEFEEIHNIQRLDPSVWETPRAKEVLELWGKEYQYVNTTLTKIRGPQSTERIQLEDIQHILLPDVPDEYKQKLSLLEQCNIQQGLTGYIRRINEPGSIKFVQNHFGLFTKEVLEKMLLTYDQIMGIVSDEEETQPIHIDESKRVALLAGALPSESLPKELFKLGISGPVAVMETFRNYRSCELSESRLWSEIGSNEGTTILLMFATGERVLFATKFEEVTVSLCVESNHPNFEEGMLYIPVGNTAEMVNTQQRGTHLPIMLDAGNRIQQVWAKNRKSDIQLDEFKPRVEKFLTRWEEEQKKSHSILSAQEESEEKDTDIGDMLSPNMPRGYENLPKRTRIRKS